MNEGALEADLSFFLKKNPIQNLNFVTSPEGLFFCRKLFFFNILAGTCLFWRSQPCKVLSIGLKIKQQRSKRKYFT